MLKKYSIKKIVISLSALLTLFLIYLVPKSDEFDLSSKIIQKVEYTADDVMLNDIFLMDKNNYLVLTNVIVDNSKIESRAKELINILIKDGPGESRIPNGFKSILPSNTQINDIKYEDGVIKIDFSKELFDVAKEYEEKLIESIVYTLTSIEGVDKVIIYIDGKILTNLPKTKINLPNILDRSFGINKEYDITSLTGVTQVNLYYIAKNDDNIYYVPVTKYVNSDMEKIKIVIDELASSPIYNTNLMSYLNSNVELLSVENSENELDLTFNSYIFNDYDEKKILEEVINTILLSSYDNYGVKDVVIKCENEEIYKSTIKTIE